MTAPTTGLPAMMTLGRALLRRLTTLRQRPGPDLAHIELLSKTIADKGGYAGVTDTICVELKPGMKDWLPTGLQINEGEQLTLFTGGHVKVSWLADIRMGPKAVLWFRIGRDGPMRKIVNVNQSFTADRNGQLLLAVYPPGGWINEAGDFNPAMVWRGASGSVRVLAVKWPNGAEHGLTALLPADRTGMVKNAVLQCRYPRHSPPGWNYLWRLGDGEIYTPGSGQGHIACHTDRDVGILQIPADFKLDASTRFSWKWIATLLPSAMREDIQPTHDYLSIAVEFDNGLDLTYMWSSELPVDTIFQCPLPWWIERETHWVIRSDPRQLGRWLSEDRNILSDYTRAIGGPMPERIVSVWLIANSLFQRGEGKCEYSDIVLKNAERQLAVK
jgi:Protein of unknown function (DUF3047)